MNIVVIGRGNVGGGLAALWRKAGHEVTELSRRGDDASGADVIVVAVPGSAMSAALGTVTGLAGKVAIDATNAYPFRSEAFRHKRRRAGFLPVRLPRRAVNETKQHSRRHELASPDGSFGWPIPDLTPALPRR